MASYYVYSGAAGAANGTSWADAYTSLVTAISGKAAGDIFYVADDHVEAAATITLASPGTSAAPCFFYSVDRAGSVPPVNADLSPGAAISSTGNGNVVTTGVGFFYGFTLTAGNSTGAPLFVLANTSGNVQFWKDCSFVMGSTGTGAFGMGAISSTIACYVELDNCTFTFSNTAQTIHTNGMFHWKNTPSAILGTLPTTLFGESVLGGRRVLKGVDLSALNAGEAIMSGAGGTHHHALIDCKIDPNVSFFSGTPSGLSRSWIDYVRSGGSGINYELRRYNYAGTLTTETTIIRTGGANDGTTGFSWKVVTSANAVFPFECPPIAVWNDTDGSAVTATVEGIWGDGAVPDDDEIWVEVQYLGDNSSPRASFIDDRTLLLGTPAGQTSSAETWGGSTTAFKLAVTFTPQQKGWVYAVVKCAKASSTFYVDPKVTLS